MSCEIHLSMIIYFLNLHFSSTFFSIKCYQIFIRGIVVFTFILHIFQFMPVLLVDVNMALSCDIYRRQMHCTFINQILCIAKIQVRLCFIINLLCVH